MHQKNDRPFPLHLSEQLYTDLTRVAGEMQAKNGERVSLNSLIRVAIRQYISSYRATSPQAVTE
jgi:hypothetical protein